MALTKITAAGITADSIDETKLADDSIDSEHYNDGSIDEQHIANSAVAREKIADDAIDSAKIADDAVQSAAIANDAVVQAAIADEAIDEARLQISNAGSNGQFLSKQSGNTGGLTWATVAIPSLDTPVITGDLEIADAGTVSHTITNWSDDVTYTFSSLTNCTIGTVNNSGVFVVTETGDHPSYTVKAETDSLGLADSNTLTKTLKTRLSAPTLSSPADGPTATNVVYTITSTNANDNKLVLDFGSSNFTYQSVSHGSGSKVGNTVEVTGFSSNNPAVTVQFTAEATYSVTAKAIDTGGTWGDSLASSADSITIINTYNVSFLVVGGGGGGGQGYAGGGGAGGYRSSWNSETSGGGGSAESPMALTPNQQYAIDVGAGGTAGSGNTGNPGEDSEVLITGQTPIIESKGGGRGGSRNPNAIPGSGGSGGGGSDGNEGPSYGTGGAGTANQGYAGGNGQVFGSNQGRYNGGAGGGASAVGGNASDGPGTAPGGAGRASTITGSSVTYGGGGGGGMGSGQGNNYPGGTGGSGGGGNGGSDGTGSSGSANTGGGGGGAGGNGYWGPDGGGAGGSGIVILRMATSDYSGTTTGSPTVTTSGSDTILKYTGDGTYTA